MPQVFKHLSQLCCGTGDLHDSSNKAEKPQHQIKGTVVLMKKNVLEFNDYVAGIQDRLHELLGMRVSVQLVSAVNADPNNMDKGKVGEAAYLEDWLTKYSGLKAGDSVFQITFDWDESIGLPGAFIIRNEHHSEFYLKTLTLEDVPNHGRIHFVCNSWVYPAKRYNNKDRIFFSNKTYLPQQTPQPLQKYREEELEILRGNGEGELQEWDRVYDYAVYNDLGDPDKGSKYDRTILGGPEHPYPRRGRTGRAPTKTDPKSESRIPLVMSIHTYVPRDERFGHVKLSDFLGYSLKALAHNLFPGLDAAFDKTRNEFDSFQDVLSIYKRGVPLSKDHDIFNKNDNKIPSELLPHVTHEDGEPTIKFPVPHVIRENESGWETDEEFCRETLAGVNPVSICRVQEFPPKSKLDPLLYGNQNSRITEEDIKEGLEGLTVLEAIKHNKLYILDYHDALMPYLRRINTLPTKTYATRTILFLREDGTLKPLVIELSLPHPDGDVHGVITKIIKPAYETGIEATIWKLAKAYVGVNDCGIHQLISHWLNTHAAIEPFVIATNRQLSVLHPIHKLLQPHFRDTMNINALARQTLINAAGIFETTVFPGKYALELSSMIYKDWVFTDHALPTDLVKRGMAVEDSSSPHGCRLLIEDYPFAVDGLEIWSAIQKWVKTYCSIYYTSDDSVKHDTELQNWWKEVREVGHGDLKDKKWWPQMKTINDLTSTCTIIIWVASALHAAVNFGQYPYAGYLPNRPTISRRFLPEQGTPEYEELKSNHEIAFLKTITSQIQTLLGISLIEVLSRHSSDEVYLGQRDDPEWTSDVDAVDAFTKFGQELSDIEQRIMERNSCGKWKNRFGPINMPYTLLIPSSEPGLTAKGIPNSISI